MQHEGPIVLSFQRINALLILCGTQCHDRETLRFPSGEQGGAVGPRQHPHLAGDRANVGRPPTVSPDASLQNHVADFAIFQRVKDELDMAAAIGIVRLQFLDGLLEDLAQPLLSSSFVWDQDGFPDRAGHQLTHLADQCGIDLFSLDRPFGPTG